MNLLETANDLIYGDRAAVYGEYSDEARKLAAVFSVILGIEVPVEKVPLLMVGLKLVRLSNTPTHTDSWVDIAGYAGCAGKLDTIWKKEDNVSVDDNFLSDDNVLNDTIHYALTV